ncbi:MAG: glycosyltransferase family 4 protein [Bacteroidales bacterium]|nr:glycosyltransferase family 4 protein [Bacteroidales bacterium]
MANPATVAIGPKLDRWGSWDWVGQGLRDALTPTHSVHTFDAWMVPNAEIVIVIKQRPPTDWIQAIAPNTTLIYCPIDWYGAYAEIASDLDWLGRCAAIGVHCRRLIEPFSRYAPVCYLDHPLKYAEPVRTGYRAEGSLLWVGVRTNLPPLVDWVNAQGLPGPLEILTNPERPGTGLSPQEYGFRAEHAVVIRAWSPQAHSQAVQSARAALDIKSEEFRSRYKPPAKALDFVASGLPLALVAQSSAAEHLRRYGLQVAAPHETARWLSADYWQETVQAAQRIRYDLSPERIRGQAHELLATALTPRLSNAQSPPPPARATEIPTWVAEPEDLAGPRFPAQPTHPRRLLGLMVTADEHTLLGDWCRDQLRLYDTVLCLDASTSDRTARLARRFSDRLVWIRCPADSAPKLWASGYQQLVQRFGSHHWVMICRPNEFCYHTPRSALMAAEQQGAVHIAWRLIGFDRHPNEHRHGILGDARLIPNRYPLIREDSGTPDQDSMEIRLSRGDGAGWIAGTHSAGMQLARLQPILQRYPLATVDSIPRCDCPLDSIPFERLRGQRLSLVSESTDPAFHRPPWHEVDRLQRVERQCGAYEYERAVAAVRQGDRRAARRHYEHVLAAGAERRILALTLNDLGVLDALECQPGSARDRWLQAEALDPGLAAVRKNRTRFLPPSPSPGAAGTSQTVRIALVSLLFNWPSTGGGTVHSAELAQFLAQAGYHVHHFYARYEAWGIGQVTEPTPYPADALHFQDPDWTAATIRQRFRAALAVFQPDWVVITDSWNTKPLLAEAAAEYAYVLRIQALECLCPLNNVRLLPAHDGTARQCPTHQLANARACQNCLAERSHISGSLHHRERALGGVMDSDYPDRLHRAFAQAAAVLVVNPLAAEMVSPYAPSVQVVTAGMDPRRFPWPPPQVEPPTPGRIRIVFAGLVNEWMKGFHVLQTAARRLWDTRQDFEVVVTDSAPTGPVDPFVRYVGWQSQKDLPRHLAGADIVAVPTVAQEALGRTAVEAMAVGRPVVAGRIGGLPFTVPDGGTGLLFEPGNARDLADKLARLLDDPELRQRLGVEGRRRFEEHFAWPVIIEHHYRPLFGAPRPTPSGIRE